MQVLQVSTNNHECRFNANSGDAAAVISENFILYAGASEPRNMAYMNRLGIWGHKTPFREFGNFIQAVERR